MTDYHLQMQLNEMQEYLSSIYQTQMVLMNNKVVSTLVEMYYEEIVNEKGELHHLYSDEKVNTFFQKIESTFVDTTENKPITKKIGDEENITSPTSSTYQHNTDDYWIN